MNNGIIDITYKKGRRSAALWADKIVGNWEGWNGVFKDYLGKSDKIDGNWV